MTTATHPERPMKPFLVLFSGQVASLMVPERHLTRIQGIQQAVQGGALIVTAPLGALLVATLPMAAVMAVDVATALVALAPLPFIRVPQPEPEPSDASGRRLGVRSTVRDIGAAVAYLRQRPGHVPLVSMATLVNLCMTPALALLPLLVIDQGAGVVRLGWLNSTFGIGTIAGGILLGVWGGFSRRLPDSVHRQHRGRRPRPRSAGRPRRPDDAWRGIRAGGDPRQIRLNRRLGPPTDPPSRPAGVPRPADRNTPQVAGSRSDRSTRRRPPPAFSASPGAFLKAALSAAPHAGRTRTLRRQRQSQPVARHTGSSPDRPGRSGPILDRERRSGPPPAEVEGSRREDGSHAEWARLR